VILVDTSAWVEFDRATGSAVDLRLTELIGHSDDVGVTEPVVAEVVAGARTDEREEALRRLLHRFDLLSFDGAIDLDSTATIYRRCRRAGITPRGLYDCMIAAVAVRHDVPVLSYDADFARMAEVTTLRLDPASVRPA
jgi:predicted nucleic acid-binding protein